MWKIFKNTRRPSKRYIITYTITIVVAFTIIGIIGNAVGTHHRKPAAARSVPVHSAPVTSPPTSSAPSTPPPASAPSQPASSVPHYRYVSFTPDAPGEYRTKWGLIIFQRSPQGFIEPTPQSYNLAGVASNGDLNVCTDLSNVQNDLNSNNGSNPQMAPSDAQAASHDMLIDGGPLGTAFRWYLTQFQNANAQSTSAQNAALVTLLNATWGICTTYLFQQNPAG